MKAPFACPNSSDSNSSSPSTAQLTGTKAAARRGLPSWIALAINSFARARLALHPATGRMVEKLAVSPPSRRPLAVSVSASTLSPRSCTSFKLPMATALPSTVPLTPCRSPLRESAVSASVTPRSSAPARLPRPAGVRSLLQGRSQLQYRDLVVAGGGHDGHELGLPLPNTRRAYVRAIRPALRLARRPPSSTTRGRGRLPR